MKLIKLSLLGFWFLALGVPSLWAYEDGPTDSGKWVYGVIKSDSGSKCKKKYGISIWTENGYSKEGSTNSSGEYKVYVRGSYAKKIYFKGSKIWTGSEKTKGGAEIDLVVDSCY